MSVIAVVEEEAAVALEVAILCVVEVADDNHWTYEVVEEL